MKKLLFLLVVSGAIGGVLAGCSSLNPKPSKRIEYYDFNHSLLSPPQVVQGRRIISVTTPELSGIVARRGIVTRLGTNQTISASQNQWANLPQNMLAEAMSVNLQQVLPDDVVVSDVQLATGSPDNLRVNIFINRFNGSDQGAEIAGRWQILQRHNNDWEIVLRQDFIQHTALPEDGFPALVKTLEASWQQLGRNIAGQIQTLPRK